MAYYYYMYRSFWLAHTYLHMGGLLQMLSSAADGETYLLNMNIAIVSILANWYHHLAQSAATSNTVVTNYFNRGPDSVPSACPARVVHHRPLRNSSAS